MARILVIDDEADLRKTLNDLLTEFNHEVIEASIGREGLILFHQHPVDLVIVDIALPGISGLEVIQRLRADFPDAKIIAITGYRPALLSDAKALGAQVTFIKPFGLNEMIKAVEDLTGGKSTGVEA